MMVVEGLEWVRIYWKPGGSTRKDSPRFIHEVKDPPCFGWQHAFVIRGERRSVIFCPYSFNSYQVSNGAGELETCAEPPEEFHFQWMAEHLARKWAQYQNFGFARDYDTAALVMRRFGLPVPAQLERGGEEDRKVRGGKETSVALAKPVKATSKRGVFLRWFLDGGGARPVREAMAEFGMTRSNALSYLFILQKDHGIGYVLQGDVATVTLPDGCTNPFDEPYGSEEPVEHGAAPEETPRDAGDDWLEGGAEEPVAAEEDDDDWLR